MYNNCNRYLYIDHCFLFFVILYLTFQCLNLKYILFPQNNYSSSSPFKIDLNLSSIEFSNNITILLLKSLICLKKGFKGLRISLNQKMRDYFKEKLRPLDMGLEYRLKENVNRLSGGQRQALTLLMMVLSGPALILLDEHTAALDPKNAEIILRLTNEYIGEYRLTAMMVTHNMSQAIEYGNRIIMMNKGNIILDISGEEKQGLTVEKLVEKFHAVSKETLDTDEVRLA